MDFSIEATLFCIPSNRIQAHKYIQLYLKRIVIQAGMEIIIVLISIKIMTMCNFYIHSGHLYVFLGMDHYLVLKKKEILQYRATWMNIN
jgi:hypothetical protein